MVGRVGVGSGAVRLGAVFQPALDGVERAEDLLNVETAGGLRALQDHIDGRLDALVPRRPSDGR